MKEFIEKLNSRLEEERKRYTDNIDFLEETQKYEDRRIAVAKSQGYSGAYFNSIEIVNQLAEEYKNTNIITDFLQYARDNADNYDTNEGWSLADLIDLSIKYSQETINTSTDTLTTNADRIRSMTDEELAEFLCKLDTEGITPKSIWNGEFWIDEGEELLEWLQSEVEGVTENE